MSSQLVASHRENAEIYRDAALCKEKTLKLLEDITLPKGLLPLDDVVEVGYNRTTGFVWLKRSKKKEHRFRSIGRTVSYDTEVTAFVEERRMRRVTGVKSKELFIWVSISDIFINDSSPGKITFANPTGVSRTFPTSAFDLEGEKNGK